MRAAAGATPDALARAIGSEIDGVTVQTTAVFAIAERKLALDMSGDVISIMNVIGFVGFGCPLTASICAGVHSTPGSQRDGSSKRSVTKYVKRRHNGTEKPTIVTIQIQRSVRIRKLPSRSAKT